MSVRSQALAERIALLEQGRNEAGQLLDTLQSTRPLPARKAAHDDTVTAARDVYDALTVLIRGHRDLADKLDHLDHKDPTS